VFLHGSLNLFALLGTLKYWLAVPDIMTSSFSVRAEEFERARPADGSLRVGNKKHATGMCRNKGIACLAPRLPGEINKFALASSRPRAQIRALK
jgi:hypothetical protein